MRCHIRCASFVFGVLAATPSTPVFAQAPAPPASVRRLTVEDAVRLALEQNLGIQIERINPQLQDIGVEEALTGWTPNLTSSLTNNSQNNPSTSALSGGQAKVTDSQFSTQFGLTQTLRTGATYELGWNNSRATSSNVFTNFDPLLNSNVSFSVTQPLLRNFKVDTLRQALNTRRKEREAADVGLQSTIISTTRDVKNAYYELGYQIANLSAQQQSLDLSKRLLADNEKRVRIGTMAPIDIVEAQAEVARNDEAVIVAEAGIRQSEDRLRALVFDPVMPDFWSVRIEPAEPMPFVVQAVDVDAAVRRAIDNRTDVQLSKNGIQQTDLSIDYFRNQSLPEINAQASYRSNAVGGVVLSPLTAIPLGGVVNRSILSERGYGSVLGDVLSNAFPTWTVGVIVSYPVGTSAAQTSLARAKLQRSQQETQLRDLELQIATEVRDVARRVQTNQKRVDSARASRELAEQRLDAEEKKFAAGMQISFFVFQAQRDLAQARISEIRAVADYNEALVDLEAVQSTAIR